MIDCIMIKNTTANLITNLDIGITDAGAELIAQANFAANGEKMWTGFTDITIDFDGATSIFASADNWNSANLIIYIKMSKVF